MRTALGFQVDAWGALGMDKASKAKSLEKEFLAKLKNRHVKGLEVTRERLSIDPGNTEKREHIVLTQALGEGDLARLLIRFAKRGKDLELSWWLFEQNPATDKVGGVSRGVMIFFGIMFLLAGLVGMPFGVGFCLFPIGGAMIGSALGWWKFWTKKTTASTFHQFDSRALAQTVDYVLMRVLATNGFTAGDLRIVKESNIEGLGKLRKSRVIEDLV